MQPRILVAAFFMGITTLAAAQSSYEPQPSAQAAGKEVFAELRKQWADNLREKRIDACVAEYAGEGEFIQPDGTRIAGSAAIRELYMSITAMFDSDLIFDSTRVESVGDLTSDSGEYREILTVRASGKRMFATGSYLTVYRRQTNGDWLILKQKWSSSGEKGLLSLDLDPHPVVALTFDDLPAVGVPPAGITRTEIARKLSSELNKHDLAGTYGFVNASKLDGNSDAQQALRLWVDAGMSIGSHTWSHVSLTSNTAKAFEHDIEVNEPVLKQYAGSRDWHWFRYPFLWEGDTIEKRHEVRAYLQRKGYRVAQVTLDFEDYAWNDAYARCSTKQDSNAIAWLRQSYLDTAAEYIRLGREEQIIAFGHEIPNVLLLHETAFTTLMLPNLIALLQKRGFHFATLADVERAPAFAQDPDAAMRYGGTLPDQFMDSRKLKYPPFKAKPFERLKSLCQ